MTLRETIHPLVRRVTVTHKHNFNKKTNSVSLPEKFTGTQVSHAPQPASTVAHPRMHNRNHMLHMVISQLEQVVAVTVYFFITRNRRSAMATALPRRPTFQRVLRV